MNYIYCLFSGHSDSVNTILMMMCFTKEPKEWRVPVLDANLCKERALPLNRSGETPLDVAKRAGFYEEIRVVYEDLGLPTTIALSKKTRYIPKLKISRQGVTKSQKNFCKFSAFGLELENFSRSLEQSIQTVKGANNPSKKRKYNPEPMIISPGASRNLELEGSNASLEGSNASLESSNASLEGFNASFQKKMAELQKEMDDLSARISVEMAAKDVQCKTSLANKPSKKKERTTDLPQNNVLIPVSTMKPTISTIFTMFKFTIVHDG